MYMAVCYGFHQPGGGSALRLSDSPKICKYNWKNNLWLVWDQMILVLHLCSHVNIIHFIWELRALAAKRGAGIQYIFGFVSSYLHAYIVVYNQEFITVLRMDLDSVNILGACSDNRWDGTAFYIFKVEWYWSTFKRREVVKWKSMQVLSTQ